MKKILFLLSVLFVFAVSKDFAQSCGTTNIDSGKAVTVGSEQTYHLGSAAVDGNPSTSWWPSAGDNDSIYVDLGQSYSICQVVITWTTNGRAANYKVQTSTDATNWTDIYTMTSNSATTNTLSVSGTGRYVRIKLTLRYYNWSGYDLIDFKVYNSQSGNSKPSVSLTGPANHSTYYEGSNVTLTANASDADGTVSKVEFYQGSTKIGEDASSPYSLVWSNVQAGTYYLTAKAIDNNNADSTSNIDTITVNPSNRWTITGNSSTNSGSDFLGTLDNRSLAFRTNNTQRMYIDSATGFVGIGTKVAPNSEAKLAVNGPVYATKLKVTQTGWSDYVFGKNYKLPSLNEVESYIKLHSHLPGIPSAAVMKQNGNDVATTESLLLKKIEELTLYMIEQNKKIQKQEKKIDVQQKEIEALKKKISH